MFGTLIESKARRQRRTAGAVTSIVIHAAAIVGAVALSASARTVDAPEEHVPELIYRVVTAAPEQTIARPRTSAPAPATSTVPTLPAEAPRIEIPTITPPVLPEVTPGPVVDVEKWANDRGRGLVPEGGVIGGSGTPGPATNGVYEPHSVERVASLLNEIRPRYPENLRLAGIEGRVVVRLVIDERGRVERDRIEVVESTHQRFEDAVREVITRARFRPAEVDGRAVRMLVELPFIFAIG